MQQATVPWKPIARKLCALSGVLLILAALQVVLQHYAHHLVAWNWWNIQPAIGAAILLALGISAIVIFTRKPKQQPASENEVVIESETEN